MFVTCISFLIAIEVRCVWDRDLLLLANPFSVNNRTRTWTRGACSLIVTTKMRFNSPKKY